ncbi:MAG TPA: hypothetical protein VL132_01770 [Planctomycetaceae bacterium]|nr:hypothetical protein [Planctomycetaceae bacterium]
MFYYQNEHGSRVFFDELGPPWPKHPCTDAPTRSFTSQSFRPLRLSPKWRTQSEIREIADWLAKQTSNFPGEPAKTRQRPAWPLVKIVKRVKSGSRVFLVLNPIAIEAGRMMFVSCKSLPKCCQPGELLAIRKSTISFFDTAAMAPKEIDVMKYRSPAAFLKALIAADPQSRG